MNLDPGLRPFQVIAAAIQRSHAAMIRSEIDLLSRFPDYYDVEDFHIAQDLFHVGP